MSRTIRPAVEGDLGRVLEIEREAGTAPHWSEAEYRRILHENGDVRRILLVAEAGEVMGFTVGKLVGDQGELESVAVRLEARRSGAGFALCSAVIEWCRNAGAKTVDLEVRAGSAEAVRLYRRLGFCEVGRRPSYYARPVEDAVLMRLEREPRVDLGSLRLVQSRQGTNV